MKKFDPIKIQEEIIKYWQENNIEKYWQYEEGKEALIFDTPPPFTSGNLHMGHALNFTWIDFIARYKRAKGYNVLLPQGFDTQGLPTELKIEKEHKIPRGTQKREELDEFLRLAREWTEKVIKLMKEDFKYLAYSADWRFEYRTYLPIFHKIQQDNLIKLYKVGLMEKKEFPVFYCPNCKTSLAKAETGYIEKEGIFVYINLPLAEEVNGKKYIQIATTRPELLPACICVLVHPEDKRYKDLIGKKVKLPLYDREVPILADESVDMNFGTGAVYVCTFGDEEDVKWQQKFNLPIYKIIDEEGKMINTKYFDGLTIKEAKEKIIEMLKEKGFIEKIEKIKHRVLAHTERSSCKTPIELIPIKQWTIKVLPFTDLVVELAKEMKWIPEHMFLRLKDWAESMDWDWIVSRQRTFGTPIPFFECQNCGYIEPIKTPGDPRLKEKKCPKCNGIMKGEKDVCDVWIDSSLTPLYVNGYYKILITTEDKGLNENGNVKSIIKLIEDENGLNKEEFLSELRKKLKSMEFNPKLEFKVKKEVINEFNNKELDIHGLNTKFTIPTFMRPQGTDIIRTWAFYTIFRTTLELAIDKLLKEGKLKEVIDLKGEEREKAIKENIKTIKEEVLNNKNYYLTWLEVLINGMILGPDGRKMSKSLGNVINPKEIYFKQGSDSLRLWALMGVPGEDYAFQWKDVDASYRFLNKYYNLSRLLLLNIEKAREEGKGIDLKELDNKFKEELKNLNLKKIDGWILSELDKLLLVFDKYANNYEFNKAQKELKLFMWEKFADFYVELIKPRLFNREKEAYYIYYYVLLQITKLLSYLAPFTTEYVYINLFKEFENKETIFAFKYPELLNVEGFKDNLFEIWRRHLELLRKFKAELGLKNKDEMPPIKLITPNKEEIEIIKEELEQLLKGKINIEYGNEIVIEKF
ncbi:MAG: class I tRNA ligase family protein [Nanoarchaeota archaeon]